MPRYLQIVTSSVAPSGPPDPAHMAAMQKSIMEAVAAGTMIATGGIGKRATGGARVIRKGDQVTVEDPPKDGPGGPGWMGGGGWAMTRYADKAEAIRYARETLAMMGDGMMELIEIKEFFPGEGATPTQATHVGGDPTLPNGVVPYLSFDGAADVVEFYKKAFGATEIARMFGQDGKKIMHCHLEINGGALMLADNFPEFGLPPVQRSASYVMQLVAEDGDAVWERAIKAGCTVRMPFAVAPWGDRYGQMSDPFGVLWGLSSPVKK